MADHSAIEWTETTWNPTTGCDKVSPGCDHCYAMTLAKRLKGMGQAKYQTDGDPRTSGPGFGLALHYDALMLPLSWRKPRRIFVNSMSDLFHARVPREFVVRVWDVMARTPQHTYQILTKRPERMNRVVRDLPTDVWELPLSNVWLGTSVEDQERADQRLPHLCATPAAVRFLSCEPLLGPIRLPFMTEVDGCTCYGGNTVYGHEPRCGIEPGPAWGNVHWVITGGESGPDFRPADPDWFRSIRDQCQGAGVAYLHKQNGGRTSKAGGRELDGRTWDEYPVVAHA